MKWALVGKAGIPHVREEALRIAEHLRERGEEVLLETQLAKASKSPEHTLAQLDEEADIFVTVGGDGTILMALQHTQKPVLGVNAGAIGFMAEVEPERSLAAVDKVMAKEYKLEERDKLSSWLDEKRLPDATNEVTLQTSLIAKLIHFLVSVDGEHVDNLRGDGFIVSTATGSTGYAMSVGAPLLHPHVKGVVLAPIAPFRLAARPWVIPMDSQVEMTVLERDSMAREGQAKVVVDGQHAYDVSAGETIRVGPSDCKARFIRFGSSFYERVRTRLTR